MNEIKEIDGLYYLIEEQSNSFDKLYAEMYKEPELYSGIYKDFYDENKGSEEEILIIQGKPHTGLSTGDFDQDKEFLFRYNLPVGDLNYGVVYLDRSSHFHNLEELNEMFSYYHDGVLTNGWFKDVHTTNGKLTNGFVDEVLFENGKKLQGLKDKVFYSDGILRDGMVDENMYTKGVRWIGHHNIEGVDYHFPEDIKDYSCYRVEDYKLYTWNQLKTIKYDFWGAVTTFGGVLSTYSDGTIKDYKKDDVWYCHEYTGYRVHKNNYGDVVRRMYFIDGKEVKDISIFKKIKLRLFKGRNK